MLALLPWLQRAWIAVASAGACGLAATALAAPATLYAQTATTPFLPLRLVLAGATATAAALCGAIAWRAFDARASRALALGLAAIVVGVDVQLLLLPALHAFDASPETYAMVRGVTAALTALGCAGVYRFAHDYPLPIDWRGYFAAVVDLQLRQSGQLAAKYGTLGAWQERLDAGVRGGFAARGIDRGQLFEDYVGPIFDSRAFWLGGATAAALAWAGMQLEAWRDPAEWLLWSWTYLWVIPVVVLCILLQMGRHAVGDADTQRRLQWIVVGSWIAVLSAIVPMVFYSIVGVASLVFDSLEQWLYAIDFNDLAYSCLALALWAWLVGLAVSIFFSGSGDPRLVLRRSTLYTLLGVGFSALFVALQGLLSTTTISWFGGSGQTSALLAGALVTLVFGPLRTRADRAVARMVDRMMPATELAEGRRETRAVVFSDLSGYTALSARDERSALILTALFQKESRTAAEAQRGRLVKTIGDAVMLEFPSVDAALSAWRDAAKRYAAGAALLGVEPLPAHTGLHLGEVVLARDGDVYGAAVNLAARLQGQAGHWELVLSSTAAATSSASGFEPMGALALKNVPEPVECVKLRLAP